MESWRKVFREGLAPLLSEKSLRALYRAVVTDDPRLLQGATTSPPPLVCVQDWPVEAGCALGYCGAVEAGGFKGDLNPCTVAEAEEFFAQMCYQIDQRIGEPAGCRWFLNWFDETPRDEVRRELAAELAMVFTARGLHIDGKE